MLVQIALGSLLLTGTTLLSAALWALHERLLHRIDPWLRRPPYLQKILALLTLSLGMAILMLTVSVWAWALTFHVLRVFEGFEAAMYFSLVAFTTLGFGDMLLPLDWRLLGGFAAANGLLLFGLLTAVLVETLRELRLRHAAALED